MHSKLAFMNGENIVKRDVDDEDYESFIRRDGGSHNHVESFSAPSYSVPAPSYSVPTPSYSAPTHSYSAPAAPSYSAPALSYSAPAPSYSAPLPILLLLPLILLLLLPILPLLLPMELRKHPMMPQPVVMDLLLLVMEPPEEEV